MKNLFSVLYKLRFYLKKHFWIYLIALVTLNVSNVVVVAPPIFIGKAVDAISSGKITAQNLNYYVFVIFTLAVLAYILNYTWGYSLFSGQIRIERQIRTDIMAHLLKMSPPFYEKNKTGDLMAKATNDMDSVGEAVGYGLLSLSDSILYSLSIVIVMGFFVSWPLTFFSMLPLPILIYLTKIGGSRIHQRYTLAQTAFGQLNDHVLENITGVRVVRAYSREESQIQKFNTMTKDVWDKNMAVEMISALFFPMTRIFSALSYIIAIGYGAYLVFQGQLTSGQLISFTIYLNMLVWPMVAMGEFINVMERGNASMDRIQETLDYRPDVPEKSCPSWALQSFPLVFEDYHFTYPSSSAPNLKSITFTLQEGQTLGIVGKTGSGKTTLLKTLLRQYPPGSGTVNLGNIPLEDLPFEQLYDWIGYVPQDHVLFSKSILENLKIGKPNSTFDEIQHALSQADFQKDLLQMKDGLDTVIGERGIALSGGQKQRISIARALLKDPEILILDDALSAVDAKTEAAIIEHIRQSRNGKTTLISTHRLSGVQHADHILVLDRGQIAEEGNHHQLMSINGWYAQQFRYQQLGGEER